MTIKFNQSCPTCGRRIDVRASLLGCIVACQHCGAEFTATADEDMVARRDPGEDLLKRVEQALEKAERATAIGVSSTVD
jgi:ribosomal protein L37AE/L43A